LNIEEYAAERHEQIKDDLPPVDGADEILKEVRDTHPAAREAKKTSRYERLKRARDQYKLEAETLRARLGQAPEPSEDRYQPADVGRDEPYSAEETQLMSSLESALHMHGDGFESAYHAFIEHCKATGDKASYDRVMNSADVGAELVQWHNEMGNPISEGTLEEAMQQGRQDYDFQQQLAARDAEIRLNTEVQLRCELRTLSVILLLSVVLANGK
jgi:hypothetical protein